MGQRDQTTHLPKSVPQARADSFVNAESYAANAEVRAVEEGHHAFFQPGSDRHFTVTSDTVYEGDEIAHDSKRKHYRVEVTGYLAKSFTTLFSCTCPSGENRPHLPVPCKHAALVGRRLVREGLCTQEGALFYVHPDFRNVKTCDVEGHPPYYGARCPDCLLRKRLGL